MVSLATVPPGSRLGARGGGDARGGDAPAADAPTRVLLSLLLLTPTEVADMMLSPAPSPSPSPSPSHQPSP